MVEINNKEKKGKLPYEKPRVRAIELHAVEVLAVACKINSQSPGPRSICHPGSGCAQKGS